MVRSPLEALLMGPGLPPMPVLIQSQMTIAG
jgi:hypothetical protein